MDSVKNVLRAHLNCLCRQNLCYHRIQFHFLAEPTSFHNVLQDCWLDWWEINRWVKSYRGYCQWYNTLDLYFYLQHPPAGELESTSAEYQLLEQMNRWTRCSLQVWDTWPCFFRVTCTKYTDMRQVTQNVSKGVRCQVLNIIIEMRWC